MRECILALAIALGGCASVVSDTAKQLEALNPLSADPADLALRAHLPDGLAVAPGSAKLTLSATQRGGQAVTQSFSLRQMGTVLDVDPSEHEPLRALQAQVRAWKMQDPDGTSGSLSVYLEPCFFEEKAPIDGTVSVDIRLAAKGPFLPLLRNVPMAQVSRKLAQTGLRRCSGEGIH